MKSQNAEIVKQLQYIVFVYELKNIILIKNQNKKVKNV